MFHQFTIECKFKNILTVLVDIATSIHDKYVAGLEQEEDQLVVEVFSTFTALALVVGEEAFSVEQEYPITVGDIAVIDGIVSSVDSAGAPTIAAKEVTSEQKV